VSQENNAKAVINLIDLGTITTVLIPLLYTAGWSFAYHYFQHFHLGMQGLNIQKEFLFLYSFWVIEDHWFLAIVAILVMTLVYVGIRVYFREPTHGEKKIRQYLFQSIGLILVPAVILGLFTLFYQLGDSTADSLYEKQAKGDFPSYPRVRVYLNEKAAKEAGDIVNEWSNGCYRLLLRDKENLYIFLAGGYIEKIATEVIPQGQVRLVRILPLYRTSEKCKK
jgi:hypothetical protein